MFTGIIQAVGEIAALEAKGGDLRLRVRTGGLDLGDVRLGDSIAVSGVCLTAVELPGDGFWADVSGETLAHTILGNLKIGARVNLEKALLPTTRLGGHLVSGHVDGVGRVAAIAPDARAQRWRFEAPAAVLRYVAKKGSICVDGVSLTVNEVDDAGFEVALVPHTVAHTRFSSTRVGDPVNFEVDLIARYVERLMAASTRTP